jgi:hypothetical protein
MLTPAVSVLGSIVLPLVVGVRDLDLIACIFAAVWFIYAIIMVFITFPIVGRRNLKKQLKGGITDKWGTS